MESSSALRPLDESLLRELPQLSLRIAPLREPVSSRTLSVPSPLEPNASGARDSNNISNSNSNSGKIQANAKEGLPTVTEFLNAARIRKTESSGDSQSNVERPPRPILPAFVNLRALEKFPFSSSFDDDALQGPRKRRRRDPQADSFSEHLQLPIPQAQKEQRPPPFGPFAILNGLNEPPPNMAKEDVWPCWENGGHFEDLWRSMLFFLCLFNCCALVLTVILSGAVCINKAPGSFTSAETKATHGLVADHDKYRV